MFNRFRAIFDHIYFTVVFIYPTLDHTHNLPSIFIPWIFFS